MNLFLKSQVTLDRSLQRNQLEKLLRLHMVEASTREEGVIQVARNSWHFTKTWLCLFLRQNTGTFLQVAVATSNIGYTVLYFLLTTLAVFLISLGVAFYLVATQLDDLRHSYFILLISYSTGCSFILWLCFDHHCVLGCLLLSCHPTRKSPSLKLGLLLFWSPYHVVLGCPPPTPPLLGSVKQAISILYYPRPQ